MSFEFWKKLNSIIKSNKPLVVARNLIDTGAITNEELAWALVALASIPIAMLDTLDTK